MGEFSLLHGSILNSSVWVLGTKEERIVWITILAMKDREGVVKSSMVGLADRAKVTLKECEAAVRKFEGPDKHDTSKVDGGRRLRAVPGGWQVVNHEYYRYSSDERREQWRMAKAAQRARIASGNGGGGQAVGHGIGRYLQNKDAPPEVVTDVMAKVQAEDEANHAGKDRVGG